MPKQQITKAIRLEFAPGALVHANLSGDEACGIDRLRRLDPSGTELLRFGESLSFPLSELLDLPGAADDEADLEGMAVADGYLWVVGSHGLKRKNVKDDRDNAENAKRLAKVTLDSNRRLLACLPIETGDDGSPCLVREAKDGRRARRLEGCAETNGLRGPVLRGWSALLEISLEADGDELRLVPLDDDGTLIRKHFLQLEGLGIRDLHFSGDDLYILAGPTMVLDGDIRVYQWPNARSLLAANQEPVRFDTTLKEMLSLPHGRGTNRAEALCEMPPELFSPAPSWLVLYDAPGPDRKDGEYTVYGDVLHQ